METIVLIVHVLTALAIIALILLQQGKGAVAGASFGAGASQTVFGSQGSGNFFSRMTAICAVVFFATSFGLAIIAKNKSGVGINADIPSVMEQQAPAEESDVPQVDGEAAPADEVPEVPAE
ncbi:preprotein translocase subunit SecG [Marinimicrobium sp. ARAG 43.8]|uniref:preprotein translocase subunit SecG n=1 Tax=Marinimicrobium sp. ARAG 43.8 TaxID=3418719 RepID=UPI003CF28633